MILWNMIASYLVNYFMYVWLFSLWINPGSHIIGSEGKNIFKAIDTHC